MKTKGDKLMKKTQVKRKEKTTNIVHLFGILLIGIAILDFALSWMGTNLTYFLGPLSRFSPMIIGFIGFTLMNIGEDE
tara:strand:+ start:187 stop:420 length:234 start_codon:yes stop_codon:yes gene_type:complete